MAIKKDKQPTLVARVERALSEHDDFATMSTIVELTKLTRHQVEVTLHHLKNHKAVDAMEVDKMLWWYSTPGTDTRIRHVEERAPEAGPRRKRAVRKAPGLGDRGFQSGLPNFKSGDEV